MWERRMLDAPVIAIGGTITLIALAMPIDEVAKLGVAGACIGLVWWMLARSLPALMDMHKDGITAITSAHKEDMAAIAAAHTSDMAHLTSVYRDSINDVRTATAESSKMLLEKLDDLSETVTTGLSSVQGEIKSAAQGEAQLLRKLVEDKHGK